MFSLVSGPMEKGASLRPKWGTLSATNPVALVPDLSAQNTVCLILRSGTSATGFVAERVPHYNAFSALPTNVDCIVENVPSIIGSDGSAEEFRGWPVRPPRQLPPLHLRQSRTRSQDRHFTR